MVAVNVVPVAIELPPDSAAYQRMVLQLASPVAVKLTWPGPQRVTSATVGGTAGQAQLGGVTLRVAEQVVLLLLAVKVTELAIGISLTVKLGAVPLTVPAVAVNVVALVVVTVML